MDFEIFEHTADHGVRIYGTSLSEIFLNGARGFAELSTDPAKVTARDEFEVELSRDEPSELLVAWFNELIFIQETENVYLVKFQVDFIEPSSLRAKVWGEEINLDIHTQRACIKAATYHELKLEKREDGWFGQVIFDV